jgi:hypothetical protein
MQTRVMKLCCQGCGADLQVTDEVRLVTCNYCQSKLEIVRDASITHTRVLEKLEKNTDRIVGDLKVIQLQNDLLQADREWEILRKGMMLRGSAGDLVEPSRFSAIFIGAGTGFFGLAATIIAVASAYYLGILMGVAILALGIWFGRKQYRKAANFHRLQKQYDDSRRRMLRLIETERGR